MAQNRTPAAWRGNGGWLAGVAVEERPLSNKSNRARQDDVLTAPLSRAERQRRHANQAATRRREGDQCWELDALDPNALRECVGKAIEELIEPVAWERCETVNKAERVSLHHVIQRWTRRLDRRRAA